MQQVETLVPQANAELTVQHRHPPAREADAQFAPIAHKMRQAGVHPAAIRAFRHYYGQLVQGNQGYVRADEIEPVTELPAMSDFAQYTDSGAAALPHTAVLKLNGGLGTTMGMQGPKSLLEVKEGLTFLDTTVRQVLHTRQEQQTALPLLFMNSFNTHKQSLAALKNYPELRQSVPLTFLQHQAPKLWKENLAPASWPADPSKEWCPPGHGDLYLALQTSGMLGQLLAQGYKYLFVSNIDNLGATLDLALLGYFAQHKLPFMMEVTRRKAADRKGGHLARRPGQGLILREVAQCAPEEVEEFQDIARHAYFNTNNLWLHLPTLKRLLDSEQGLLGLPLIANEKPVDPTRPLSPPVYQLETAMGHAIALFPVAQAVEVPRARFLPIKNTNDLLALWSDAYVLNSDYTISLNPARQVEDELLVDLDKSYYGLFYQLKARFPRTIPSLVNCRQFRVKGDIYFDTNLVLEGNVSIQHDGDTPARWASVPLSYHENLFN
jgi:UTP--glucose-1-phosphate uridylyltransferase